MNSFESRLSAVLEGPLAGAGKSPVIFLAAVSGGADSTAMLTALAELRKEAGFILHCAHVEHGIRPAEESQGDARAVEALCKELEVPCRVITIPPGRIAEAARSGGSGIEGAARSYRMRALRREARRVGAEWILTAHTRDDLFETLLMRILRGSGPAGLAAMPRTNGRILRPLLDFTRQDVLAYLGEKGIPYRTDSTNADIRFLRNRVRLKLVPLLDDFFPSWRSSLSALAETQSLIAEFLASEAEKRLPWERLFTESGPSKKVLPGKEFSLRLPEADFLNAPPILREEAIFAGADILAAYSPATIKAKAKDTAGGKNMKTAGCNPVPRRYAVRRAAGQGGALAADLGSLRLGRQNGFIEMKPTSQFRGEKGFSLLIKEAGSYTLKGRALGLDKGRGRSVPGLLIRAGGEGPPSGSVDIPAAFYATFPLVFRNHRTGDWIYRGGHKRRFSDVLDTNARSEYTGTITVEDTRGPAAIIGMGRGGDLLVISREDTKAGAVGFSLFEVSVRD